MQALRNLIDKTRKLYREPGSRFHKMWPLFDAMETFLFTPDHRNPPRGPHVRDYVDLKRVMVTVIIALLPCFLWSVWNTGVQHFEGFAQVLAAKIAKGETVGYAPGWLQGLLGSADLGQQAVQASFQASGWDQIVFGLQQMLPIVFVSYFVGLNIEALFSVIRKEEISEGYLVSGMLIALIVPPSIPLWQLAIGVAFAVVLAKEVFGGTGMNIFNPALMCRAFLFFAFPAQMSGDQVWVAGNTSNHLIDGFSGPTALAIAKSAPAAEVSSKVAEHYSTMDLFLGDMPGSAGEISKLCVLLGAFWLVFTGVGSWRTMVGGVLGMALTALLMNWLAPAALAGPAHLSPLQHLLSGGFLFGIVFMATDPVSSPETSKGRWIYGALIGAITVLVRSINPAYPEGTMLAILLLNAFAPGIDHFVVAANIRRRMARQ